MKVARTVLKGESGSNAADLLNNYVREHEYANQNAKWENYECLAKLILNSVDEVSKAGGNVLFSFSGKDLCKITDYEVVTIIAHWVESKGCIELYDGFYSPDEFVKCMPVEFSGLLDLSVCHSIQLIELIKSRYPDCLLLTNSNATQLEFRLLLYKAIIKLLKISPMSYTDAYTYLMKQLIKNYQ